jgi:starch phosphorylase
MPDFWLDRGNPWEIERIDINVQIRFYGKVREELRGENSVHIWENTSNVVARAYDNPIPGYDTRNCIGLRLWRSIPNNEFDFNAFN